MAISSRFPVLLSRTILVLAAIVLLAAPAHAGFIGLTWDANPEPDIAGYVLFSGTESGTYTESIDVGNTTSWSGTTLADGRQYFFAVLAYNTDGIKSGLSNELTAKPLTTAQMTAPEPGAVLERAAARFQWSEGNGVSQYRLTIGTTFGGSEILDRTSATTDAKVSGLPATGTVYVRLWSLMGTTWHFTDYTYTAARTIPSGSIGSINQTIGALRPTP